MYPHGLVARVFALELKAGLTTVSEGCPAGEQKRVLDLLSEEQRRTAALKQQLKETDDLLKDAQLLPAELRDEVRRLRNVQHVQATIIRNQRAALARKPGGYRCCDKNY